MVGVCGGGGGGGSWGGVEQHDVCWLIGCRCRMTYWLVG